MKGYLRRRPEKEAFKKVEAILDPKVIRLAGDDGAPMPIQSNVDGAKLAAFIDAAVADSIRELEKSCLLYTSTRLIPGETAGTEVKDANAYDLCTPTHVVINLNHNSSLAEYKANIPDVVKTIKREYPDIIVILMSIDETGTYFPAKYPE